MSNSDMKNLFVFFMLQFACKTYISFLILNLKAPAFSFEEKRKYRLLANTCEQMNEKKNDGYHFSSSFPSETIFYLEANASVF